jgi:hypothetical protein
MLDFGALSLPGEPSKDPKPRKLFFTCVGLIPENVVLRVDVVEM